MAEHITHLRLVSIPVADVDRAKAFYVDVLGFEERFDGPFGEGMRWVELAPPGAQASIALVTWFDQMPPGSVTGLQAEAWMMVDATPRPEMVMSEVTAG